MCFRTASSTSKVHEYRLYFEVSPDGHFTIGGRGFVRTPTGLGTIVLSYPVSGGGYTISGGSIWAGLHVFYVNEGVPSAVPFDVSLFINGTASEVTEQSGATRTSYDLDPIACSPLG